MGKASRRKKEQRQRRHTTARRPAPGQQQAPSRLPATQGAARASAVARKPAKPTIASAASAAYLEWLGEALNTQRAQQGFPARMGTQEEPHVLAPLVRRMGQTPSGRNFVVDLSPVYDPQVTRYTLGLAVTSEEAGAKPDAFGMPQFGPGVAFPLPYELRAVRAGDAVAWLVYRAISDGKADPASGVSMASYAGRAAAVATPAQVRLAPGYLPLPSNALFDYEGFGDSAAEEPVSPELTAAERQTGPAALSVTPWLSDDAADEGAARLAWGIEEVRDYTDGLWVVEGFDLARLIELLPQAPRQRQEIVAVAEDLVREVDEALAEEREAAEQGLKEGLATPAEIAAEVAPYDRLRAELRAPTTAQGVLPVLARALFELQPPAPEGGEGEDEVLEGEVLD